MISLSKAEELKKAGLVWEPGKGDIAREQNNNYLVAGGERYEDGTIMFCCAAGWVHRGNDAVWLPSLSQLLAEIESRGYHYTLHNQIIRSTGYKYKIKIFSYDEAYRIQDKDSIEIVEFYANIPENAAGDALLWILGQEKKA